MKSHLFRDNNSASSKLELSDNSHKKLQELQEELHCWIRGESQKNKNNQISLIFIQILTSAYLGKNSSNSSSKNPFLESQIQKIDADLLNNLIQSLNFEKKTQEIEPSQCYE